MEEFKPAHQVITKGIASFAVSIQDLEKKARNGGTSISGGKIYISPRELYEMKLQQIGGLCGLLDVLREMFIPPNALGEVIGELKKLEHFHAVISGTIECLEKRQKELATA